MSDLEDIKDRLLRLEIAVENFAKSLQSSADDRKWLIRIILGGIVSAVLVFITKGGLNVV